MSQSIGSGESQGTTSIGHLLLDLAMFRKKLAAAILDVERSNPAVFHRRTELRLQLARIDGNCAQGVLSLLLLRELCDLERIASPAHPTSAAPESPESESPQAPASLPSV